VIPFLYAVLIALIITGAVVALCEYLPRSKPVVNSRLYVDDLRDCPEGWDVARNFHQAIVMLDTGDYDEVSLDHDIASFYGNKEMTGYDVLQYLIMRKLEGATVPGKIYVHSANPVGVKKMQEDIDRYF
jgi:hypothetical protein